MIILLYLSPLSNSQNADSSTTGVAQVPSRHVHNIAIDPLDENYFLSAGGASDAAVSVWDTRYVKQRAMSNDTSNNGAVLEFKPIFDNPQSTSIWSLRYTGTKAGCFGALANTGEFKILELAQHSHHVQHTVDIPFARAWSSPWYTKTSHHLSNPGRNEKARVVAFDFMTSGNPLSGQCALTLHPEREVEVLKVPVTAPCLNVTALGELYRDRTCVVKPRPGHGSVAEDLTEFQNRALVEKYELNSVTDGMNRATLSDRQGGLSLLHAARSSYQMHQDLLDMAYPDVKLPLADYLAVHEAAKRRAQEGYSLDCAKNIGIVSNDPWLQDVWTLVDRMDAHAAGDGMVGNGLDLKYLGVSSIWANELQMYDERLIDPDAKTSQDMFSDAVKEIVDAMELPAFEGIKTEYPENRQLCLSLCGWPLHKAGVQQNCQALVDEGEIHKAIVIAVFQGYKDIALALLRSTLKQKKLPQDYIGLAAVIACAPPSSTITPDQREACAWMADMTSDPYLKSLLTYFISGEWTTVVGMPQLLLQDRVAVALKYLPDSQLTHFLNTTTNTAMAQGDIAGLLLTGLTSRALDLLTVTISLHPSCLQDAVLILSRACPLYIQDARWSLWRDMYLSQMQVWRAFLERTRYIKQHNLHAVTREGRSVNKPSQPSLTLRCLNCQQNLALRKDPARNKNRLVPTPHQPKPASKPNPRAMSSPALACPNCGTAMPRCGLCMLWLGSPDVSKQGAVETLKGEDLQSRMMVFCMSCTHGFHGHHARDWFGRHAMCPVPDCGCMCGLLK